MLISDHLASRYFDRRVHTAWIDQQDQSATFPLWNLSGQLVGYQRYRPNSDKKKQNDPRSGRYFTRVKDKKVGVWGLESWYFTNTVFITEGVFDACRLTYMGCSAIAVLSYDISATTKTWLRCVRANRPVVAICDNDSSGRRFGKLGHMMYVVNNGDLGDASDSEVQQIIAKYC